MSTRLFRKLRFQIPLLLALTASQLGMSQDTQDAPRTPAKPAKELTYATILVGDLQQLIDNATALAGKVVPGLTADQVKTQLGAMVGDPDLKGLPKGSGIGFVVTNTGMLGFAEVSGAKADAYVAKAEKAGQKAARIDGMVVAGSTEDALASAKELAGEIQAGLKKSRDGGVVVEVPVSKVLAGHKEMIESKMETMATDLLEKSQQTSAPMSFEGQAKILEGELRLAYRMALKVDTMRVTVKPSAEGLRIDSDFVPIDKPKLSAAKLPSVETFRKLLPAEGAYRIVAVYDPKVLQEFMDKEFKPVLSDMKVPADQQQKMSKLMDVWLAAAGNGFAADMMIPGKKLMSGNMVLPVADAGKFMEMMDEMPTVLKESGILELYREMGMDMSFEFKRNVRKVAGYDVSTIKMDMKVTTGPAEMKAMMDQMMGGVWELTTVGNTAVYSVDGDIDKMIAAAKAGENPKNSPLLAEKSFGPGGRLYADYGLSQIMQTMITAVPEKNREDAKPFFEAMKEAPPIQFAWFRNDDGSGSSKMLIPAGLISSFAAGIQSQAKAAKASDKETTNSANVE